MIEVISSATGQYWQIRINGQVIEGFAKRGHGRATKAQVEAVADEYRAKMGI